MHNMHISNLYSLSLCVRFCTFIFPLCLQERKELIQGGFRDKHNAMGSILLGAGVLIGVEGCFNTWMRTGKLFPGPHLFAGAAIVVLWALAAALVPAMQKGDNNARNMHIALNALNVALFAWQVRFIVV
jgi:hypothetical protein